MARLRATERQLAIWPGPRNGSWRHGTAAGDMARPTERQLAPGGDLDWAAERQAAFWARPRNGRRRFGRGHGTAGGVLGKATERQNPIGFCRFWGRSGNWNGSWPEGLKGGSRGLERGLQMRASERLNPIGFSRFWDRSEKWNGSSDSHDFDLCFAQLPLRGPPRATPWKRQNLTGFCRFWGGSLVLSRFQGVGGRPPRNG